MGSLSSKRCNLAVRGGAPCRKVGDDAVGRAHLFDRYTPGLGRRQQQSLARFRSGELKIIAAVPHRRGGVGPHADKGCSGYRGAGPAAPAELGLAAAQGSVAPLPMTLSVHSGAISRPSRLTDAYCGRTLLQSHCSSSATIMALEVQTP